ncbi:MAG: AMP-binding protein, partial [Ktedonobacterales bacterium]
MDDRPPLPPDSSASSASAPPSTVQDAAPMERPWLAHYSPTVPATVTIPEQPLSWLLDEAARQYGANVAIVYYGTEISYVQLTSLVDRFARALVRLGLKRGDRVSICLPNVPQFPIAFYGVLKAGGVAVPTNPLYTQPELEHQLKDSGAKIAITLDQFYPTLAAVRSHTPVEHVILTSPADYLPPVL